MLPARQAARQARPLRAGHWGQACATPRHTCFSGRGSRGGEDGAITAARTGLYVGGLIRTNACDAHLLGHEFTSVTLENDLKWAFLSTDRKSVTEYNFTTADALIAQAQGANVRVRGHVLIWDTRPQSMPSGLSAAVTSTETARAVMKAHIDTMAAHFGDRVHVFDVVNEPTLGQ